MRPDASPADHRISSQQPACKIAKADAIILWIVASILFISGTNRHRGQYCSPNRDLRSILPTMTATEPLFGPRTSLTVRCRLEDIKRTAEAWETRTNLPMLKSIPNPVPLTSILIFRI
ncbi:hypothetical protein BDW69DRAFT_100096 [Aspergillus filifer]